MSSILIITSVENLQKKINNSIKSLKNIPGVYVSLNKPQTSIIQILNKNNINTEKLFFIDCVSKEKNQEDTLYISPQDLDKLNYAIEKFIKEIPGEKFLIIDALSTLLIYNDENKIAEFVKQVTNYSTKDKTEILAFSPITKGEELLNKIFNFFDKVKKEKDEKTTKINGEELVY